MSKLKINVTCSCGTFEGHDNNGISEFLGIPFSAPVRPWEPAEDPVTTQNNLIVCNEWGPSCFQVVDKVETASIWKQSLDCLFLNIWTRDVETKKKPVIVFIHGGGAWQGGSYDPNYDGEYFVRNLPASEDVVFITFNYRLGIYGSLDLSILDGYTDKYSKSRNLAIMDQIQALKWVHDNIEAFGGNPDNVTVMGQSAGAGALSTIMTMKEARSYFKRAIIESGTFFNRQISPEKSAENSRKVYEILGVASVDELINYPEDKMAERYKEIDKALHHPHRVADGVVVPENSWDLLKGGCAGNIDVIIGTTDGEADWLACDDDDYPNQIDDPRSIIEEIRIKKDRSGITQTSWSPLVDDEVVQAYMSQDDNKVKRAVDLYNDTHYRQTGIFVAEELADNGSNVYMYSWEWAPDVDLVIRSQGDMAEVSPWGRAMHCMEQVFIFGNKVDGYNELAGPDYALPDELIKATQLTWYSFAKNGNPNNEMISEWKPYDRTARSTMVIGKDCSWTAVNDPRSEDRKILERLRP